MITHPTRLSRHTQLPAAANEENLLSNLKPGTYLKTPNPEELGQHLCCRHTASPRVMRLPGDAQAAGPGLVAGSQSAVLPLPRTARSTGIDGPSGTPAFNCLFNPPVPEIKRILVFMPCCLTALGCYAQAVHSGSVLCHILFGPSLPRSRWVEPSRGHRHIRLAEGERISPSDKAALCMQS